jgi:hypothetical protein
MRAKRWRGQTLVEFAIVITVFLVILMGVVDFGMAIYKFNGVSQAAREIARVTSVHPCAGDPPCEPGSSIDTQEVIAIQEGLIPGLTINPATDIKCVDDTGALVAPAPCDFSKHSVRVTASVEYSPITPLLGFTGPWNMEGSSSAQIQ